MGAKADLSIPASFLQSGRALPVTSEISFRHPTLREIFDLDQEHGGLYSKELYYAMCSLFLTDPYLYMVYLDDRGLDYEDVSPFQLFLLLLADHQAALQELANQCSAEEYQKALEQDIYRRAFRFFFGIDNFYVAKISGEGREAVGYGSGKFLFDQVSYLYIYEFVKAINGIQDGDRIHPEDAYAKQVLIEDERERRKREARRRQEDSGDKNSQSRLGNLISAATWACPGGITPFNRGDLHIYDLVDAVRRSDRLLQYNHTLTGLYAGTLDRKGLDLSSLHWAG